MALTTNLQAYYKLDESSGNAADSSGNGYTLTNTNTVTYSAGKINNGANFVSSSSQYFDAGTPANLNITGAMTISAWVYTNQASGTEGTVVSNYNAGGSKVQYQLKIANVAGVLNAQYNIADTVQQSIVSVFTLTANTWTHIVSVYDGTNVTLYKNGTADTPVLATQTPPSSGYGNTAVGRAGSFNGIYNNGSLDEIGIWNRALTGSEVTELYNGGAGLQYPFSAGSTFSPRLSLLGVGR